MITTFAQKKKKITKSQHNIRPFHFFNFHFHCSTELMLCFIGNALTPVIDATDTGLGCLHFNVLQYFT